MFCLVRKPGQNLGPEAIDIRSEVLQPPLVDGVKRSIAVPLRVDQFRLLQHSQVLRYGRADDVEAGRDITHRSGAPPQAIEYLPPRGISQRVQGCLVSHN